MQISTKYLQFGQSAGFGKLSTVWSLEFFIATLFGSTQRVIFEFRVQHITFQVLIDKIQLYGKMIPNYLQALDS